MNDDGEACKIDKRGVPYKVGSDGRSILPSRRPIHRYTPEEWKRMSDAEKKAAYNNDKRDKEQCCNEGEEESRDREEGHQQSAGWDDLPQDRSVR